MTLPTAIATAIILTLCLGVLFLVRRLGVDRQVLPVTTDWLEELSTTRYRPMLRMLEQADFRFLRVQKGFTPQLARRLRRQRAQVYRGYLRMIEADFERVAAALRMIVAHSGYDRPELGFLLFERRLSFACVVAGIRFQLALFGLGLCSVDSSHLIRLFDGMRLELRTLVPAASPIAA